ncbi:HD domain-containing phosphohydrolase [Neobacillus niacini]|uniref:HD-GYP domain-containing protein n=1 Tax=Neobacillus niacini TaxID=86668 RepID=UPI0030002C1E
MANTLDSKDPYTANHSENVARYSLMIAEEMELSKKQKEDIYIGGLLHDIGKIGVPESILFKQSSLTEEEFEKIKMHPVIGYNILKHIPFFKKMEY